MANNRRFGPTDLLLLLLVLVVAAGARAGYLATCANGGQTSGPLRVQDARPPDYTLLIQNVRDGHGFRSRAPFDEQEEATAHVSPGYPWLAALLGRIVPDGKQDSAVRWGQVVLGTLTAELYFLFARHVFRSLTVGVLVGLFAALHPFWILSVATIDDGVLATFALAGCLFLGSQAGEKGSAFLSLLFGLALAGLTLVRAALLPFGFVAMIWFLLRSRTLTRGWLCALLAFLGFANGLAPWMVRDAQLFQEPVPVVSSAYLHLWIGNNPLATGGPATEKMLASAPSAELRAIASQPARYAQLGREVANEIRTHPARTLQRRMRAALMFFFGERWLADGALAEVRSTDEEDMPVWLGNAYEVTLQAFLLGLFGLAILGWRWSYDWHAESTLATLALLWVPATYILGHAEGLSGPRLPLDGVLICYAVFALVSFIPGLNAALRDSPRVGAPRVAKR